MRDIVLSESSHYWKIRVPPTRFHGYFCEPVTHEFVSDPEICSNREHLWKCSFTENMINGVATIDIVIQRIEIKPGEGGGESEGEGGDESASGGSGGEPSSSSSFTLQQEQQQQQHDQGQRQQQEEQEQEQQKEQEQPCISESNRPATIQYKTIALHTPKTLAPLMSMFLDGALTAETPIRGKSHFELDAEAIRHKGNYDFEIVLSEEISSYMNPSPSSCHRVFDSLYHEMVATSHPDTSTADIWFEFHLHSPSSPQEPTMLPSMLIPAEERHRHLEARQHQYQEQEAERHDGSTVAVVGAHWEKLKEYPYFADWIQRAKQLQEEERRRQLEEEWRIHQQHNQDRQQQEHHYQEQQHHHQQHQQYYQQYQQQQQQQHPQSPYYSSWWHTDPPYGPPEYQMGEFDGPQQRQRHTHIEQPLSRGSLRYDEQQQHHYQYPQQHPQQFQHSEYHPREVPIYFRPLQGSAASLPPPSYPFPQHTGPSSSQPRHHHHPTTTRQEPSQSHQRWRQINSLPPPFPPTALRIPVNNKDVSLGTFQVILQYIYTGSIGLSEGQIHDIDKYWNHYPEEQITSQGDKNLLDDEDMPSLSSLLAYFHARERAEKSRSGGDNGSGGARIEPRPPILLPPPGPEFVDERSNEGSTVGSGAPEDRRRSYSTIKDLLAAGDMYTFTTASVQTAWIPCSPRNRRKEFRDPRPYPAPACHHEEPARGGEEEEEGEERQTGGHDSDSGSSGHRQGQGQGGCRSGGNRSSTGQHGASIGSDRGEAVSSISNLEDDSPSLATTTTDTLLHPPNRHPLIHHIRPTCSWESLLLAANLFRLHDLETTALKAIKYHCQMLASRAMINNNVMAEVAHNGFDRSNLDLQLALGERIMLSLLKLYRSSELRFHPEGVQVVRGGGEGGIESKGLQHAQRESFATHSRLGERFRRQSEGQQEKQGEDKEKRGDDDDDEKQEEGRLGRLGTIRPSSSSSSAAMPHGSSSGGAGSRRYSAPRQSRAGHQAPQGEGFTATASGGGSSGGRGGRSRSTQGPFRARSRGSLAERAEEKEEHWGVEQEEGDEEEDTVASPLELFNHPECENVLESLCKDLRERFMSMREVMDHRHRQGGNRAT